MSSFITAVVGVQQSSVCAAVVDCVAVGAAAAHYFPVKRKWGHMSQAKTAGVVLFHHSAFSESSEPSLAQR